MKKLLLALSFILLANTANATVVCEPFWQTDCTLGGASIDDVAALPTYHFKYDNGSVDYRFGASGTDADNLGMGELISTSGGVYDLNGINPVDAVFYLWSGVQDFYSKYNVAIASKAPLSHTHIAADITDSTAVGRSLLTASSAAAARSSIGAGTQISLTSQLTNDSGFLTSAPVSSVSGKTGAVTLATSDISGFGTGVRSNTQIYSGATQKLGAYPVFKSATTTSGVATFYLTSDGTSTGAAIFPNGVDATSFNFFANDSSNIYTYSVALSNGNKTATVTAKRLNLLALGLSNAADGTTIFLSAWGN